MFYKIKKAAGTLKVGDFVEVHKDQQDEFVKAGLIDENGGNEENPDAPKAVPVDNTPQVGTTKDILKEKK